MVLAELGEGERPANVPQVEWQGKMTSPIANFVIGMVAAGHSDVQIQQLCEEYFGGPRTTTPIRRLRETHAAQIAEKVESLSREIGHIPIVHKAYRLRLLNEMALDLLDRFKLGVISEPASGLERLGRTLLKTLSVAQAECEGQGDMSATQTNIYVDTINALPPEKLEEMASKLETMREEIASLGSARNAIDAEFTEEAEQ